MNKKIVTADEKTIRVSLFGGFSMRIAQKEIFRENKLKTNKALQLLVFLLCSPGRKAGTEMIVNAILDSDELDNPNAVCKNLVYRLRKILRENELVAQDEDAIVFENDVYNLRLNCVSDLEAFNACWEVLDSLESADRFESCKQALSLYSGVFLGNLLSDYWVLEQVSFLENRYLMFLNTLLELVEQEGCYQEILDELSQAFALYPHEESVYMNYIKVLYECKHYNRAFHVYDNVCERLLSDLGLQPPPKLLALMKTLTLENESMASNTAEVHTNLCKMEVFDKAHECGLYEFSHIYQAMLMGIMGIDETVRLVLCTVYDENGNAFPISPQLDGISQHLRKSLRASLQSGDAFARYSSSQFVILLKDSDEECCRGITSRVRTHFHNIPKMRALRLTFSCTDLQQFRNE